MNTPCGYGRPSWFERSNRHDRLRYHFQATALGVEVHTAPVSTLVQLSDREPERYEEVTKQIEAFVEHFIRIYGA